MASPVPSLPSYSLWSIPLAYDEGRFRGPSTRSRILDETIQIVSYRHRIVGSLDSCLRRGAGVGCRGDHPVPSAVDVCTDCWSIRLAYPGRGCHRDPLSRCLLVLDSLASKLLSIVAWSWLLTGLFNSRQCNSRPLYRCKWFRPPRPLSSMTRSQGFPCPPRLLL